MSNIINIQSIIEKEISLSQAKSMVIMHKGEVYQFFDEGTSRHVFVNADETKVIKILKIEKSFDFNKQELEIYNDATDEDKKQMVVTTLFYNIIEQDYCTPIKFGGKKLTPEERIFALSCRNEVGWDKDNNLVCFDLDEFKKY